MSIYYDPDNPVDSGDSGDGSGGGIGYVPPPAFPPVITTTGLPNGTLNAVYSQIVATNYGNPPYRLAITAGALPAGLVLNMDTGEIAGTPTVVGFFSFVVTVTDEAALTGSALLSITIPSNPSIVNASLPAGAIGVPYGAAFSGAGGFAPYQYIIAGGALPPGLSLASTGGISGTPTTQGTFSFLVQIADSGDPVSYGATSFSITIGRGSLVDAVRSLDQCVLVGAPDGGLYAIAPGLRHDEDYDGQPVGWLQRWKGVPTGSGKLAEQQLGGATVGAKGNGSLNVSAVDDSGRVTRFNTEARPMNLVDDVEVTRDFMARGVPKSPRFAPDFDNGGVVDAWFELHVGILWMRPFWGQRKA